jgi:predicted nuclease of predicted toxin-antitoxin system
MIKIIIDNCVSSSAKFFLEQAGYNCKWVGDFLNDPGDEAIMDLATNEQRVIITLDKDFGELAVFKGIPHFGIIRIVGFSSSRHGEVALSILQNYSKDINAKALITVDTVKIRIRSI